MFFSLVSLFFFGRRFLGWTLALCVGASGGSALLTAAVASGGNKNLLSGALSDGKLRITHPTAPRLVSGTKPS